MIESTMAMSDLMCIMAEASSDSSLLKVSIVSQRLWDTDHLHREQTGAVGQTPTLEVSYSQPDVLSATWRLV